MNRKTLLKILAVPTIIFTCMGDGGSCSTVNEQQRRQTNDLLTYADQKTGGMPRLCNFYELQFAKRIMMQRDRAAATVTYVQNISSGKFICLGKSIGYGLPYAAQITNPLQREPSTSAVVAQADPNGLYLPQSAEGTWVDLIDPKTGMDSPVHAEPRLLVLQFELPAALTDVPCSALGYGRSSR